MTTLTVSRYTCEDVNLLRQINQIMADVKTLKNCDTDSIYIEVFTVYSQLFEFMTNYETLNEYNIKQTRDQITMKIKELKLLCATVEFFNICDE